jgi:signal peptidase I
VLAFLLSLLAPGAGHFLVGRFRRGAAWAVGLPAVVFGVLLVARGPLMLPGVLLAFVAGLGGRIAAGLESARAGGARPAWRWVLLAWAALLAGDMLVFTPARGYIAAHHVQAFRMPSGSMQPTLLVGDFFLADHSAYRSRPPARGELVVLRSPAFAGERIVKRVVALPGETVQVRGGLAIVDGRPLTEPYRARPHAAGSPSGECDPPNSCEPVLVPPGAYYVLGDDRANSMDSRHWGFVARERILGRVSVIYWSWDPERGRARWERVGRRP